MSKTGWIVLIVCLCLVLCICAGILLAGRVASSLFSRQSDSRVDTADTKNYKDLNNPYAADGVYTVQMNELTDLTIDWIFGSVTIELTGSDVIRIQETSMGAISEKNALRYGVSGSKLRIQACKKGYIGQLPRKELTVYLPRSLAAGLKECEIDTVSASVSAGDLKLDELEINTVSGRVRLSNMIVEEAQVDTVSGPISLLDCEIDSLRLDSVSGKGKITGAVRKVKSSSVSGEIDLTLTTCSEIKISTMSGDVTLALSATPKELQIDTTSGKTRLALPRDASCTIDLDTMSGKLYLNDAAVSNKKITLGDGSVVFDIDSMSGSVWVDAK